MSKTYVGKMNAEQLKFGIVVSRFNEFITGKLLAGAMDALIRHNTAENKIEIVWTPGSFEIPLTAQKMAESKKYDAIICLGAIIKGDTSHNDYIASEVAKGIAQISLKTGLPVIFGVLTTDNIEQAIERAGSKGGNKGAEAAETAIELANLFGEMGK